MEKYAKPLLTQVIWVVTAVASCCIGLTTVGLPLIGDITGGVALLAALVVGMAGFVGMILLFVDQPDYCKFSK